MAQIGAGRERRNSDVNVGEAKPNSPKWIYLIVPFRGELIASDLTKIMSAHNDTEATRWNGGSQCWGRCPGLLYKSKDCTSCDDRAEHDDDWHVMSYRESLF